MIGIGLPVYLAQAVMRGALQGDLRLGRLAVSYAVEAATRVGIALVMLALGFGVIGAAVAISLSFVASAIVARHRVAAASSSEPACGGTTTTEQGGLAAVSVAATVLLVGQVVIANGDVVLAKAVMAPEAAGAYAAAAIIGRGLYFLSWAVVHSTFPVVARATSAEERRGALLRALAMVVSTCVVGVAGLALLGDRLAPLLLGDGYREAAEVLVPYAVATALFAVANLVASLDLAIGRWRAPAALLVGAALQTLLLIAVGATPMSMAVAQVVAMAVTALLVCVAHLCDNRSDLRGSSQRRQPTSTETDEMTATSSSHPAAESPRPDSDSGQHQGRKVLFLGTHGQANVGDELLLDTFLTELGPDNAYAVNSYDPAATAGQLTDRFDVTVFDTGSDRMGLIRNLLGCNVVVFGGGNILKELYRSVGRWKYSTLVMVLAVVLLARLSAKPVLMANVGIGPVESAPGRLLVRAILRLVWLISVRDEGSFRFAQSVGCPAHKLRLVPDAVWVRDPDSLRGDRIRSGRHDAPLRIALNLNKDVDVADEWDGFLNRLVVALGAVADARPVEFHALPMQCGFKSGTDLEVLEDVLGRLDAPVRIHAPADHREVCVHHRGLRPRGQRATARDHPLGCPRMSRRRPPLRRQGPRTRRPTRNRGSILRRFRGPGARRPGRGHPANR